MPLMIDWMTIKSEYISTRISTRELAQKHGVSYSTLEKRARREQWTAERGRIAAEAWQKTTEATTSAKVDAMTRVIEAGEKAESLIKRRLDEMEQGAHFSAGELKTITAALKDLRDLYRTEAFKAEDELQKARELLAGIPDNLDGRSSIMQEIRRRMDADSDTLN